MAFSTEDKIAAMKAWAEAHYEAGGDMMVECWVDTDYRELLIDKGGDLSKAIAIMKEVADVFHDQELDALNSAF